MPLSLPLNLVAPECCRLSRRLAQESLQTVKLACSLAAVLIAAVSLAGLSTSAATSPTYPQIFADQFNADSHANPPEVRSALSAPLQREVRDATGRIWRAAGTGLIEIDPGGRRRSWRGEDGLPVLGIDGIACGARGAIWLATRQGAILFDPSAPGARRWFYFAGRRYLPDDTVIALAPTSRGAWVRTAAGISRIEFRPFTLGQKAAYFEARLARRHRRDGFVDGCEMPSPGDLAHCQPEPSDNDGLWTAIYVAAECFRYAVTGSAEALSNAQTSLAATLRLEAITGTAGFPARAIAKTGETRDPGGEWHPMGDGSFWKGDTSSDELVGHFFADWVAWNLLPAGGPLRHQAAAEANRIARRLVAQGLRLVGPGGRVTRWGRYTPDYFKTPEGREDAGLDSLELLSHLRVAASLSDDASLKAGYRRVAIDMRYLDNVAQLDSPPAEVNFSDQELAYLAFAPLLVPLAPTPGNSRTALETDPALAARYLSVFDRYWRRTRDERNPLWEVIAAAATHGGDGDLQAARDALERIPMDTVNWTAPNAGRADVVVRPQSNRFGLPQSVRALPPNERAVMKWNGDPFELGSRALDGGDGGRSEDDGAFFLLPYWMGRYYSLIGAS